MKNYQKFLLIFLSALIFILGAAVTALRADEAPGPSPEIGRPAPDFTLSDLSGKPLKLSDLTGKVVVLNFWASWCPPCKTEIPAIEKLNNFFNPKELMVVTVSLDSSTVRLKKFIKEKRITFPVLSDAGNSTARLYQVRGIPTTLVINKKGIIVSKDIGAKDWAGPDQIKFFRNLIKEK